MDELLSILLSGMFAALSYKGSFFRTPDYLIAAMFGAVIVPVFIGEVFGPDSWLISASGGYVGGLIGCFFYSKISAKPA